MKKYYFILPLLKYFNKVKRLVTVKIFGEVAKLPYEPKIKGWVVNTETPISFNEWVKLFSVGSKIPKRIILTKEQIANEFGFDSNEIVIV
jgi:hypothetical protein